MGAKTIDLTGKIFGKFTVLSKELSIKGQPYWLCRCDCGFLKNVIGANLRSGQSKSCGCDRINKSILSNKKRGTYLNTFDDLTGKKFNRWTVISHVKNTKPTRWLCRCDCGVESEINKSNLISNKSKSCGCLQKEITNIVRSSHSLSKHPLYKCLQRMKNRCYNNKANDYKHYGGRGIKVCERWHKFDNFYADMGERPEGMSIDRIDSNGDYEPSNCRWATIPEQLRNKRNNIFINTPWGRMVLHDAAIKSRLIPSTVYNRYRKGWRGDKLLSPPLRKKI